MYAVQCHAVSGGPLEAIIVTLNVCHTPSFTNALVTGMREIDFKTIFLHLYVEGRYINHGCYTQ